MNQQIAIIAVITVCSLSTAFFIIWQAGGFKNAWQMLVAYVMCEDVEPQKVPLKKIFKKYESEIISAKTYTDIANIMNAAEPIFLDRISEIGANTYLSVLRQNSAIKTANIFNTEKLKELKKIKQSLIFNN